MRRSAQASYKAGSKAVKAFGASASGNTDAAAAAALTDCISVLCAADTRIAALVANWDSSVAHAATSSSGASAAEPASGSDTAPQGRHAKRVRVSAPAGSSDEHGSAAAQEPRPAVVHSYDLGLDDPAYLAVAALLAVSRLRASRGEPAATVAAPAAAALALFPACIAAHLSLARALLSEAATQQALNTAERHLRAAVAAGAALADTDAGLMVDSNKVCAAEASAAGEARGMLAMLLCQQGRDAEAAEHLAVLGYAWRLAPGVLHYPLPHAVSSPGDEHRGGCGSDRGGDGGGGRSGTVQAMAPTQRQAADATGSSSIPPATPASCEHSSPPLAVLDDALPAPLLERLQRAFEPASPFWAAHNYGPRQGYFSYVLPLVSIGRLRN